MNKTKMLALLIAAQMVLAGGVSCNVEDVIDDVIAVIGTNVGDTPDPEEHEPEDEGKDEDDSAEEETDGDFWFSEETSAAESDVFDPGVYETEFAETEPYMPENPETAPYMQEVAETEGEEEDPFGRLYYSDELPEMNFGGSDFRFFSGEKDAYQFFSEEKEGEGLLHEVYRRNKRVEERFDVKIGCEHTDDGSAAEMIMNYVMAGMNPAEIIAAEIFSAFRPVQYGCYANWLDMPYVNFSQPWWNYDMAEGQTVNGKLFHMTGDLAVNSLNPWCIAFNGELLEEYGDYTTDDLYYSVLDGTWSLETMVQASSIYTDLNGDGAVGPEDLFGFGTSIGLSDGDSVSTIPWLQALGGRSVMVDDDEQTTLLCTLGEEQVYEAVMRLIDMHSDMYTNTEADDRAFSEGRAVFYTTHLESFGSGFGSDLLFVPGLLPMPKLNEYQEMYYTSVDPDTTVFSIAVTLPMEDYELVGVLTEAMAAETWKRLCPAYFDSVTDGRYSSDQDFGYMLEILMSGRVYDFGTMLFSTADPGISHMFNRQITDHEHDFSVVLRAEEKKIEYYLEEITEYYQ